MSPELHSPTVTIFSPAKLYNRKMKSYIFVCLSSYQMILLMNKTTHSSYFTEIIISSRFKKCCLFVTLQILSTVTDVLSIKRRSINNSTCMLNRLDEGEMICLLTLKQNVPSSPYLLTSITKNRNHCMHPHLYVSISCISCLFNRKH